ncbi:MAG TPA: phytoene/squalene synthase family protein [Planctomycetaceae bacterium]
MTAPPSVVGPGLDASFTYCRRLTKRTAKNFYYSFLTLPADVRRDMCALYAYMRVCDDLGDEAAVPVETRRARLAEWRRDVVRALEAGETAHPVLPALAEVARRRGVPADALLDVVDGVEMDLSPVRYETFGALADYCYHVAGAVGVCCIHVWGFEGSAARERAIDCGLAFQLTNILRDLAEDSRMGRVYLPAEDLDRFGYGPDEIAAGVIDDRFRRLMAFQVARARDYYRRSEPLSRDVAPAGRPVLAAMRRIYGGLLDEIERRDYDVFRGRVSLPRWKKLAIAAAAMWRGR